MKFFETSVAHTVETHAASLRNGWYHLLEHHQKPPPAKFRPGMSLETRLLTTFACKNPGPLQNRTQINRNRRFYVVWTRFGSSKTLSARFLLEKNNDFAKNKILRFSSGNHVLRSAPRKTRHHKHLARWARYRWKALFARFSTVLGSNSEVPIAPFSDLFKTFEKQTREAISP